MSDAQAATAAVPTVRLGGLDWEIPVLAIKQNRIVVPAVLKLVPQMAKMFAAVQAAKAASSESDPAGGLLQLDISTETFDLMSDAVYAALTRAKPLLARTEFDNLPISLFDLVETLAIVMEQSGAFKRAAPGESQATMAEPGSTSTASSPA